MPRPSDVTNEKIQAWTLRLGKPDDDGMKFTEKTKAAQLEAMLAGFWLEEQILPLNLSKEQVEDSCTSCGQISFGRDPWEVAEKVRFLAGEGKGRVLFTPGEKLANDLMEGKLDILFGPGPGIHSPDAVRRLKLSLDISKLTDLIARAGASTLDEAQEKMQERHDKLQKIVERRGP